MDPLAIATSQLDDLMRRLTPRQMQVIELLVQGCTITETARLLSIGRETVKTHIKKIHFKLDTENRIQIIVIYAVWKTINNRKEKP